MKNAKKYIKKLQSLQSRTYYNDYEMILERRKKQLGLTDEVIEEQLKQYKKYGYIGIIEDYYNNYLKLPFIDKLPVEVREKVKNIYIGVLPTYQANASAIKSPENEPIIILHSQLLTMIKHYNEMQFIFGKLMMLGDYNGAKEILHDISKEICKCFIYHKYLPTMSLLPTILEESELMIASAKADIQILFIIAHELAHIYLGHLDITENIEMCKGEDKIRVESYIRNQKYELEADKLAAQWIIDAFSRDTHIETNHMLWRIFKEKSYMAFEAFMMFHLIDINADRYNFNGTNENTKQDIASRFLNVVKELDDLMSSNRIYENVSHPKAVVRLFNIAVNTVNSFDDEGESFVMEMIRNAMFYETFRFNSIID